MPVDQLLGGHVVRDCIKAYAWVGGDRPADIIAGIKKLTEISFDTFTFNGCEEMWLLDNSRKVDAAVAVAAYQVREELLIITLSSVSDFYGLVNAPMVRVL